MSASPSIPPAEQTPSQGSVVPLRPVDGPGAAAQDVPSPGESLDKPVAAGQGRAEEPRAGVATEKSATSIPPASAEPGAKTPAAAMEPLAAHLDAIAAAWGLRADAAGHHGPHPLPSPEALLTLAAQRGLDVEFHQRSVLTLSATDFPCVVLLQDGAVLTLVGRSGDDFQTTSPGDGGRHSAADLAEREAGFVFFPRPKLDLPKGHQSDAEMDTGPLATGPGVPGVFRLLVGTMWREHKGRIVQLFVANAIGNLMLLALPIYSMAVYDRVIPHMAMETLWALSIGVMIALVSDLAVRAVKTRVIDAVAYSVSTSIQARFFNRLLHTEMAGAPRSAAAATAGLRDIESLCLALPNLLMAVFVDLPFLLIMLVLLAAVSGWVAVVPIFGMVTMVAIYALSHLLSEREMLKRAGLMRAQSTLLQESIDGLETVKVMAAESTLLHRWERLSDATAYSGHLSRNWNGFATLASMSVGQIVIVFAMFAAVFEISNGLLTIGALSATSMLVGRMLAPVSQIVSVLHQMKVLVKTLDGIDTVLKAPVERAGDPKRGSSIQGLIEFRGVDFSYPGSEEGGLKNITLTIRPGEKVALIGRIGCGKSTLLKLMLRLIVPRSGSVLLDGTDIRQFDPTVLRRHVGFMGQNHALFDDTLHANLCMGLPRVTAEAFERAARVSGIGDVAARQPDGYSMRVGPRGERLSGGERQLVALARTLIGNPSVLILDEPTAAMDNGLEARIVRDLKQDLGNRTLIVATHRAAVLELVDRIIWLDDGRIVADGPKNDVINRLKRNAA